MLLLCACRNEERYMTFSHDAMLINVVKEAIDAAAGRPFALPAPHSAAAAAEEAEAAEAEKPAVLRCSLKQQFKQRLGATVTELGDAEAAAAEREWWQQGSTAAAAAAAAGGAGAQALRMVAPPGVGDSDGDGCSSVVPAVDFCSNPLDSSFWWAWYPEESWADAAAVADQASSEALRKQSGQEGSQQGEQTPAKQQKAGDGHHLAAASVQHHQQGQRERVFTMRGAVGVGNQQQQQQEGSEDEGGEMVPGMPAAGSAAAAAAAGPPPRVVAAAARSFAVAAFAHTDRKSAQQQRKQAPSKKAGSAAATVGIDASRPSVAERVEAAVKAITTYTLCLAEARRQKLLVRPPSSTLARLALGELALRVELEQQRQTALMLKAGIARSELMVGNSAATDKGSGLHINTQGVECAVCGCDLSLAAVVSSEDPGRAVCPAHADDLDGPRSSTWLLLRYPPGYLDQLVATGTKVIPGAAEAIEAARRRQSWVAAGRFYGGAVLRKSVEAPAAAAAGGIIPVIDQERQQALVAAAVAAVKQEPATAGAEGVQEQQWKQQVPVLEVKLLGRLYDPNALSKKLFEDLEGSGGDSSSQSMGWDDDEEDLLDADGRDFAEQQQGAADAGSKQQQGAADAGSKQQQRQLEGESGGDASSEDWWQGEGGTQFEADVAGSDGEGAEGNDADDDFRPDARRRKRRRPAAAAEANKRRSCEVLVKVEQHAREGNSVGASPDVLAA
jgi:hypothetical protein